MTIRKGDLIVAGSGGGVTKVDNISIITNPDGTIKANAVINQNNEETVVKTWCGTLEEYNAIEVKDEDTFYYIQNDTITEERSIQNGGLEIGDIGITAIGINEELNLRRYLNGQVIDMNQFISFTDKLTKAVVKYPSLACTEEEWQTAITMSAVGQCGKFVLDNEAMTIRLPKIIMPIQGLTDLSKLAEIVEAGLPDHTHYIETAQGTYLVYGGNMSFFNSKSLNETGSASETNSIYGNSETVQQEQIQYPYFIQVANGVEESLDVTRELTLNNPFSLLDYKYSEYELNNASWLLSTGQLNSGDMYPAVFELLSNIYNNAETKEGVSVKLSTEEFTDYDFVLNNEERTFRLPKKVKLASGKAVVGNGITLGLTVGTSYTYGLATDSNPNRLSAYSTAYGKPIPTHGLSGGVYPDSNKAVGVTTDPTKSGIETSDEGLYLYFYVGETLQDASIINTGKMAHALSLKTDMAQAAEAGMPSDRYIDLTLGASGTEYIAPANGYFYINKVAGSDWYYIRMRNAISDIDLFVDAYRTTPLTSVIPAKKGEKVRIEYNATGTTNDFRFIYAEGSK